MNRSDVEKILIDIGMKTNLLGFEYITDAVMIIYESEKKKKICDIYKEIAEKSGKTASSVERAIRAEIAVARKKTSNPKLTEKYLGDINSNNSQSITQIVKVMNIVNNTKEPNTEPMENMIRRIVREELERIKNESGGRYDRN